MNAIPKNCKHLYKSTYKNDYIQCDIKTATALPIQIQKQEDPGLISGQFVNNLHVENIPLPHNINYPHCGKLHEEYKEFVKRILPQANRRDREYFCNSPINLNLVCEEILKSNRSCYQNSYSPNKYVPKWKQNTHRTVDLNKLKDWKLQLTTYLSSYNRINEIGDLKKIAKVKSFKPDISSTSSEIKKVKTGKSVYYEDICEVALARIMKLRRAGTLMESPLDRYTLRRV